MWTGREAAEFNGSMGWLLPPTEVPAMGYALVSMEDLSSMQEAEVDDAAQVETARYRVTFDRDHGGIVSLYDKLLEPRVAQ